MLNFNPEMGLESKRKEGLLTPLSLPLSSLLQDSEVVPLSGNQVAHIIREPGNPGDRR